MNFEVVSALIMDDFFVDVRTGEVSISVDESKSKPHASTGLSFCFMWISYALLCGILFTQDGED